MFQNPHVHDYSKHEILLDEFRVEKILGIGGMGKVYLVRRLHDEAPFALKVLHETALKSPSAEKRFFKELRTWIDLPRHPHLATLCFIRTIDGRIGIFSEYLDGGTLSDRIETKGIRKLDLLLDFAIQSAWGIEAAHAYRVVHKDVKSSNMLLTRSGVLKITDFGLSKVIQTLVQEMSISPSQAIGRTTSRGMTIAFCSPEQFAGRKASYASDVWSWGVTVLEMLTGGVRWQFGYKAPLILRQIRSGILPGPPFRVPDSLWNLLEECFREDPNARHIAMKDISQRLPEIWRETKRKPFPRPDPDYLREPGRVQYIRELPTGSDWNDPIRWMNRACELTGESPDSFVDPAEGEISRTKHARMIRDLEIFSEVEKKYRRMIDLGRRDLLAEYGRVLDQKGIIQRGLGDLNGAMETFLSAEKILTTDIESGNIQPDLDLLQLRIRIVNQIGLVFLNKEDHEHAAEIYRKSIRFGEELVYRHQDSEHAWLLISAQQNLAITCFRTGRIRQGIDLCLQSIRIVEDLLKRSAYPHTDTLLFSSYMNSAFGYWSLNELDRAERAIGSAARLAEQMAVIDSSIATLQTQACCQGNWGLILVSRRQYRKAVRRFETSIGILTRLLDHEGFSDFKQSLAETYMNLALALDKLNEIEKTKQAFEKSLVYHREFSVSFDSLQHDIEHAKALVEKTAFEIRCNDCEAARISLQEALTIYTRYDSVPSKIQDEVHYHRSRIYRLLLATQKTESGDLKAALEAIRRDVEQKMAESENPEWRLVMESIDTLFPGF